MLGLWGQNVGALGPRLRPLGLQLRNFEPKLGALQYGLNCVISTHVTRQYIATFSLMNEPLS